MLFDDLLNNPAKWMVESRDEHDIVLTSRIRLARNLTATPFPGWATRQQRAKVATHRARAHDGKLLKPPQNMRALLNIYYVPPTTEQQIIVNPIGMFIRDFSWSNEL